MESSYGMYTFITGYCMKFVMYKVCNVRPVAMFRHEEAVASLFLVV